MSSLCKLTVQGVRSFSPDEPQKMDFYPLTIILGPNGAGKTTIIECLRYITTSECPPNSQKGKLWVFDPKLYKAPTVRGQIKLSFLDSSKLQYTATRTIELTSIRAAQNKARVAIRTLDAVIKRPGGTSANAKCVDIAEEMLGFLGVSKAVLTNVIFCHQEESNWPLSEGKVLKDKFDAIFGSNVYVKALKKIKDLRKDHKRNMEVKAVELKTCEELKHQWELRQDELKENQIRLQTFKSNIAKIDEQLVPNEQKFKEIERQEQAHGEFESKLAKMRGKLEEQRKTYKVIQESIKIMFDGSASELKSKLANFKMATEEQTASQEKLESKIKHINKELTEKDMALKSCLLDKGKWDHMKEDYENTLIKRNALLNMIEDSASGIEIDLPMTPLVEMDAEEVNEFLTGQLLALKHNFETSQKNFEAQIEQLQTELDTKKMKKANLEHSKGEHAKYVKEHQEKQKVLEEQLRMIGFSGNKLQRLRLEKEEKRKDLETVEATYDVNAQNERLSELQGEKKRLQTELDSLDIEMSRMQLESASRTEFSVHEKSKAKEEGNLEDIYERHRNLMDALKVKEGNSSFYSIVSETINKFEISEQDIKKKIHNLESEKSNCQNLLHLEEKKEEALSSELKANKDKIQSECGYEPYESLYSSVDDKLRKLRKSYTSAESCRAVWEEIAQTLKSTKKCPVCLHHLATEKEKDGALKSIESRIRNLPQEKSNIAADLKSCEEKFEKLLDLKSIHERVTKIPNELKEVRSLIDSQRKEIHTLDAQLSQLNADLKEKSKRIEKLKSVLVDAMQYDRSKNEIEEITQKMTKIAKRLGVRCGNSFDSSMGGLSMASVKSLDSLRDEIDEKKDNIKSIEREIEKLQRSKEFHRERLDGLKNELHELDSEILNVQKDQQSRVNIEEKVSTLAEEIVVLNEKITSVEQQLLELEPEIEKTVFSLEQLQKKKRSNDAEWTLRLQKLQEPINSLKSLDESIAVYNKSGGKSKLERALQKQKQLEASITELADEEKDLKECLQSILKDIDSANSKKRDLEDNLRLIECAQSIKSTEDELESAQVKLGSVDLSSLRKQKHDLWEKISKLRSNRDRTSGSQYPIIDRIKELESELKKDKYKNSVSNYRQKIIELNTEEIVCSDLDKYYRALDYSVTIYHQKKMEEINKLVYKFWKEAYRGGDIDFVKIVYDNVDDRSSIDKRKNYDYRVVMVKKKMEMDMRGRCSAGQKVLASLIIRLALAEIFCINCGILALDEPTTNLDKENIHSLANAIANLVEYHKAFKNFQLIIITHDEEFLKCLDEDANEYYYRVYKDYDGYSKLKRCSIREQEDRYNSVE